MDARVWTGSDIEKHHGSGPVSLTEPVHWLRAGWNDVRRAPALSALVGVAFTVLCAVTYTAASALPLFAVTFFTLLLAVSPFLATLGYSVARQLGTHGKAELGECVRTVRKRAVSVGIFATLCGLTVAAWLRFSTVSFALYYGNLAPSSAEIARVWTTGYGSPMLLIFLAICSVMLAVVLFALSAVSLPVIVDQDRNIVNALQIGYRTMKKNMLSMTVWMAVLTVLIGVALMSNLMLMPLIFPLLAYATWHGYHQLAG